jgi:hypothetical protein
MIERIFLDWQQPCLPLAANWIIDRYGRGRFDRMVDLVVVVPGRRAGRRLLELLVDTADRLGLRPCPPRVVTPAGLDEILISGLGAAAPRLLRELAWAKAAATLSPDDAEAVIGPPPAADELSRWLSIAATLERLHADVSADALSFEGVAARCREEGLRGEARRWSVLCDIRERYLAQLNSLEYADPHESRLTAIASPAGRIQPAEIVLVGIADLPRSIRGLLERAATQLTALVQAPADRGDDFDELGCVRPEAWADAHIPLVDERLTFCGGPNDQAAATVARLEQLAKHHAIDDIVIGVPDREVIPRLRRLLAERGVRSRDAVGEPAHRTGPGLLLTAVANYIDSQRYADLAALIRHPDVEVWLRAYQDQGTRQDAEFRPASWLTVLDEYYSNHLPFGQSRNWSAAAGDSAIGRLQSAITGLLGDLAGKQRSLADWAAAIDDFLRRVYGKRTLDVSRRRERALAECFETIQRVLEKLSSLDEAVAPKTSAAEAIRVLNTELARAVIAPPADERAVELLGWLELPLDDTAAAILTGMNEGVVPPAGSADAFLPDSFRRRLGMLHDRQRLARDAYLLSAILASRADTFVICGKRTIEGNPRTPSRLLLASDDATLARRVQRFCEDATDDEDSEYDDSAASGAGLVPGQSRSTFAPPPAAAPSRPITSLAVTAFRDYLACPYRFYLRHVLGLRALDDSDRELSAASFGSLAHKILYRFADDDVRHASDPAAIADFLSATLDDVIYAEFGREILPAVRLQTAQLRLRLDAFALWQAEHRRTGWWIEHAERRVEDETAWLDVDGVPFYLHGRIDRIDVNELTGERLIVDYKTSETTPDPHRAHQKKGEWVDLQLPLYRHLAASLGISGRVTLAYVALPKKTADIKLFPAQWNEDELRAADDVAHDVVRGIRAGHFKPTDGPPPAFSDEFAALCMDNQLSIAMPNAASGATRTNEASS